VSSPLIVDGQPFVPPHHRQHPLPEGIGWGDVIEYVADDSGRVISALTWRSALAEADWLEQAGQVELAAEIRDAVEARDREWVLELFDEGWTSDPAFSERETERPWRSYRTTTVPTRLSRPMIRWSHARVRPREPREHRRTRRTANRGSPDRPQGDPDPVARSASWRGA
jgi:hypothetical protein